MIMERWLVFALLSAICAAAVAVLGKAGLKGLDADAATLVRSLVMSILLIGFTAATGVLGKVGPLIRDAGGRTFALIALAGAAGAASWLFYFRALQAADASRVGPIDKLSVPIAVVLAVIMLGERPAAVHWAGIALITAGGLLVAWPVKPPA